MNVLMRKIVFFVLVITSMVIISGCEPEIRTYTVTFDANGGEGTMSHQLFTEGVLKQLLANAFTNGGYEFAGWNTIKDSSGKAYADKQRIKIYEDMTLYAMWEIADTASDTSDNKIVIGEPLQ